MELCCVPAVDVQVVEEALLAGREEEDDGHEAGTPTLTPIIPTWACVLKRRALSPLEGEYHAHVAVLERLNLANEQQLINTCSQSRGGSTPIELFLEGVRVWKPDLRSLLEARTAQGF